MGSIDASEDAVPVHDVRLDAFWFDRIEVPNAMYGICEAADACARSDYADEVDLSRAEVPVFGVSWFDAADYCTWAGKRRAQGLRGGSRYEGASLQQAAVHHSTEPNARYEYKGFRCAMNAP